jgi:anaphase-promoting complex subunit 7
VLYGWEAQPESRVVREVLCELELAHVSRPIAPGSARRVERGSDGEATGWAPRLVDPNTAEERVGLEAILDHLETTYALERRA